MPSSASHSASPRMPGVSMMTPPPGTITISRATVVWRPLSSRLRTSAVACPSLPTSRLTRVDFPTPDPPSSAAVTPGPMCACTASRPTPVIALSTITSTPCATSCASLCWYSMSAAMSALLSTTTGVAPDSQASTSSRSRRRTLMPLPESDWTTKTMLALAMSTCSSVCSPGSLRTNALVRGRIASMIAWSWPSGMASATQSPTTAREPEPCVLSRCVAGSARRGPASVMTSGSERSTRETRPGMRPLSASGAKSAVSRSVQPSSASVGAAMLSVSDTRLRIPRRGARHLRGDA